MKRCGSKNPRFIGRSESPAGAALPERKRCPPSVAEAGRGAVAQLGERFLRTEEVGGSNPLSSTKLERPGNGVFPGLAYHDAPAAGSTGSPRSFPTCRKLCSSAAGLSARTVTCPTFRCGLMAFP